MTFPCAEAGCCGTVSPVDGSGKERKRNGVAYHLPPGTMCPTCDRCGEEWSTPDLAVADDAAFRAAWLVKTTSRVTGLYGQPPPEDYAPTHTDDFACLLEVLPLVASTDLCFNRHGKPRYGAEGGVGLWFESNRKHCRRSAWLVCTQGRMFVLTTDYDREGRGGTEAAPVSDRDACRALLAKTRAFFLEMP